MATLSKGEIAKRNNAQILVERVNNGGQFRLQNENGASLVCTGRWKFLGDNSNRKNITLNDVVSWHTSKDSQVKLLIEVKRTGGSTSFMNVTTFFKDAGMGGKTLAGGAKDTTNITGGKLSSERQEHGLVEAINKSTYPKGHIQIKTLVGRNGLTKVKRAAKRAGQAPNGKEPYVDVDIWSIYAPSSTTPDITVSCKGDSAPSLAGGGLEGLQSVVPGLIKEAYEVLHNYMKNQLGLKQGQIVPINEVGDIFIPIPNRWVEKILKGTKSMGGPVTHMYIGPMDVTYKTAGDGSISFDGASFYTIEQYMAKIPQFYFRLRKRDVKSEDAYGGNMIIDYVSTNRAGHPKTFVGAKMKKNLLRWVITSDAPKSGGSIVIPL